MVEPAGGWRVFGLVLKSRVIPCRFWYFFEKFLGLFGAF